MDAMKQTWLRREGTSELLVVMTGWAVGGEPFRHLTGETDVLMLSDYRELPPLALPDGYAAVDLVAYSFGVAAACQWPTLTAFRRKVAVCGSWAPFDDARGIPREAMRAMAEGLSDASLRQFSRQAGCAVAPGAGLAALRAELDAVMAWPPGTPHVFDRIVLGKADRIFPLKNLNRAWESQVQSRVHVLRCGHNPFADWRGWADVLACTH